MGKQFEVTVPPYKVIGEDEIEKCVAESISAKEQGRIVVAISLDGGEYPTVIEAMTGIDPDTVDHEDMPNAWRYLVDDVGQAGILIMQFDSLGEAKNFVDNNTLPATAAFNGSEIKL